MLAEAIVVVLYNTVILLLGYTRDYDKALVVALLLMPMYIISWIRIYDRLLKNLLNQTRSVNYRGGT